MIPGTPSKTSINSCNNRKKKFVRSSVMTVKTTETKSERTIVPDCFSETEKAGIQFVQFLVQDFSEVRGTSLNLPDWVPKSLERVTNIWYDQLLVT
ncbi:hypothetical protein NPIL_318481 [Nephila pilipes]|uniref:Uncharacterized protein n=1 Tax=Nephila pilipes TaxID=299642 RepID=A0A8X6Q7M9_NEPPI|nr:hypothetical protein NPIL_667641 [Nephila pilipes]GFU10993.1 hypothetical protein NPIL_318481 [Nephila pilipes]